MFGDHTLSSQRNLHHSLSTSPKPTRTDEKNTGMLDRSKLVNSGVVAVVDRSRLAAVPFGGRRSAVAIASFSFRRPDYFFFKQFKTSTLGTPFLLLTLIV